MGLMEGSCSPGGNARERERWSAVESQERRAEIALSKRKSERGLLGLPLIRVLDPALPGA